MSVPYEISEKNDTYPESWEQFGKNLDKYISSHKKELEIDSYDVILGFSRGGLILACTFSCLLKDKIPEIYSDISKASVRPIPRGISVKTKDPCFVMNQGATDQEIGDIIDTLEKDLAYFSKRKNNDKPISVLIMDDNLTGATRVKYLEDMLGDMKRVVFKRKTLAYVRHRDFLEEEIPTIIKFPEDETIAIFSMPWHIPSHCKKDINFENNKRDLVKIKFCMDSNRSIEEFKSYIKSSKYYRIRNNEILVNGASEFIIENENESNIIKLNYIPNKYYPSKKCLGIENPPNEEEDNENLSLCSLGMGERTKGSCLACSILNCNKEMFDKALEASGSKKILIELRFDSENAKLKSAIIAWLARKFPDKELLGYD